MQTNDIVAYCMSCEISVNNVTEEGISADCLVHEEKKKPVHITQVTSWKWNYFVRDSM